MCLAALSLVGGIISGIGGMMAAQQQAAQYRAQEALYKRQAALEREAGSYAAEKKLTQGMQMLGEQFAVYGERGVAADPYVINSSAHQVDLDVAMIRRNAQIAEDNELYKSKVAAMNAEGASRSVFFAGITPIINSVRLTG